MRQYLLKKFLLAITILCTLVGVGTIGYSYKTYREDKQTGEKIKNVAKKATEVKKDTPAATVAGDTDKTVAQEAQKNFTPETDFTVDWAYLKSVNPDVVAWLYVPGTSMSYPILQESTVGQYYYLNHNLYGQYQVLGSLFMPAIADTTSKNQQLTVFGHNSFGWYGDVYFTHLYDWYDNASIAQYYKYAYVYYPDGRVETYENWSAADTTTSDQVYELPVSDTTFESRLDHIARTSRYTLSDKPSADSKIMVLSTCEDVNSTERFYACFKLLHETKQ